MCVKVKVENAIELEALTAVTGGSAIPGVAAVTVESAPRLAALAAVFTVTLRASAWDTQASRRLFVEAILRDGRKDGGQGKEGGEEKEVMKVEERRVRRRKRMRRRDEGGWQ